MSEYIERKTAMLAARHAWSKGLEPSQFIDIIPAADVASVVHGRWIDPPLCGRGACACSECKEKSVIFVFSNGEISEKYCPLCGAIMDGDDDG